jgi:hypothetical protein
MASPAPHDAMLRARLSAAFERLQARWRSAGPESAPLLDYERILRDWAGRGE